MLKKRLLAGLLTVLIMVSIVPCVSADEISEYDAAWALYELGLMKGTGNDAFGNPNFDLERTPNRHEAITMLVRLLGKDETAQSQEWTTPFWDVADWARPYVGFAYNNGLTNGTGNDTYGGYMSVSAAQYITFVLRALGYTSGVDFEWDEPWLLSDSLGLTNGQFSETSDFDRGDAAIISYNALHQTVYGSEMTLIEKIESGYDITVNYGTEIDNSGLSAEVMTGIPYGDVTEQNMNIVFGFGEINDIDDPYELYQHALVMQGYFSSMADAAVRCLRACGDYDELSDLKVNFGVLYGVALYGAIEPITVSSASDYLIYMHIMYDGLEETYAAIERDYYPLMEKYILLW